jgi:hypothetical protein
MARRTLVVPFSIACAIVVPGSPLHAQTGDSQSSASVERIRAALEREPAIQLPAVSVDPPMFRVEVRPPNFIMRPIEEEAFDPTFGLPSAGELLMGGIEKIRSAAVRYKRGRARRRARTEVDDALAAFCAVHECPTPSTTSK